MLSDDGNVSKVTQYHGQRFKAGHKRLALCTVLTQYNENHTSDKHYQERPSLQRICSTIYNTH